MLDNSLIKGEVSYEPPTDTDLINDFFLYENLFDEFMILPFLEHTIEDDITSEIILPLLDEISTRDYHLKGCSESNKFLSY